MPPNPSTNNQAADASQIGGTLPPLATTNYGNQVAFNYGKISNYFCHSADAVHHCDFTSPPLRRVPPELQSSQNLKKARELISAEKWTDAKELFYEVLHSRDVVVSVEESVLIKYSLGRAHFALAEHDHAATNFQAVVEWVHQQKNAATARDMFDGHYWLGRSLFHMKKYEDASLNLQVFLILQDERGSRDPLNVTGAHLWLGLTFECLESYVEAKDQLQTAWRLQEQEYGPEHLQTLTCRHHLANLCFKQKGYQEARDHFLWLLDAEERLTGPERAQSVATRCMLAFSICEMGEFETAEPHLLRLLSRMESQDYVTIDQGPDLGLARYWFGRVHFHHREFPPAEWMFQRALSILSQYKQLADKLLDCQLYMGASLVRQDLFVAAEQILGQVLQDSRRLRHGDEFAIKYWLARAIIFQGKCKEGLLVLEELPMTPTLLQESQQRAAGAAGCLSLIGEAHHQLKDLPKARECFQRLVDIGPGEPNELYNECRVALGVVLFELGQFIEAREQFQSAYEARQSAGSLRDGAVDELWLAWSLCELQDYDTAETYLTNAIRVFHNAQDRVHPAVDFMLGRSRYYLGRIMFHRRNIGEAEKCYRDALPMIRRRHGHTDPIHIQSRYHLARCLLELQRHGEAQIILEELTTLQHEDRVVKTICLALAPYRLGILQMQKRQYEPAHKNISKCLEVWDSTSAASELTLITVQYQQAICDFRLQRYESSINALQTLYDQVDWEDDGQAATHNELNGFLAHSFYFCQRFAEACPHYEKRISFAQARLGHDAEEVASHKAYLADAYCELGRFAEAQPLLESLAHILDDSPNTSQKWHKAIGKYWLGRRLLHDARHAEGAKILQEALQLAAGQKRLRADKLLHDSRHFLARAFLFTAKYAEAEGLLAELLRRPFQALFASQEADNYYYLGLALRNQRKHAQANDAFAAARAKATSAKIVQQLGPKCQYFIGLGLYNSSRYSRAKAYIEAAIKSPNPFDSRSEARCWLGNCEMQLNKLESARQIFQGLVEEGGQTMSDQVNNHYLLGKVLERLARWKEAQEHLEFALENTREKGEFVLTCRCLIGSTYFSLGDFSKALEHLRAVKRANGLTLPSMILKNDVLLARCHLKLEHYKQAHKVFQDIFSGKVPPTLYKPAEYKKASFHYAECLMGLHKNAEAQTQLESILPYFHSAANAGDATVVQIQHALGQIAYLSRQWDRAANLFQEALVTFETIGVDCDFDVWRCRLVLGNTLRQLNRYDAAIALHQRVYDYAQHADDATLQAGSKVTLLDAFRQAGRHADALKLAQKSLARWESEDDGSTFSRLKVLWHRVEVADVAVDMRDWPLVAEVLGKCVDQLGRSSEAYLELVHVDLARLYSRYSYALKVLGRHEESNERGLQAVNCKSPVILFRAVDDPGYDSAFVGCLGFDPSELVHGKDEVDSKQAASDESDTIVQTLSPSSESNEVIQEHDPSEDTCSPRPKLDSVISDGSPRPKDQNSSLQPAEMQEVAAPMNRSSPTDGVPVALRSKPPKPPRPPKPSRLGCHVRMLAGEKTADVHKS